MSDVTKFYEDLASSELKNAEFGWNMTTSPSRVWPAASMWQACGRLDDLARHSQQQLAGKSLPFQPTNTDGDLNGR